MKPPRKPSPTESPLLFEIDDEPLEETLTSWGGVPLVVQAFRSQNIGQANCFTLAVMAPCSRCRG